MSDEYYILISCVDSRLAHHLDVYARKLGLSERYFPLVLPGSILSASNIQTPDWSKTFFQQFELITQIANITSTVLINHYDCAVLKKMYGRMSHEEETELLAKHLTYVKGLIKERYPNIAVRTVIMDLDGNVENVFTKKV